MNTKTDNDPTDILSNIAQVEAPPFLLTRIHQRIRYVRQQVPIRWLWATAMCMLLILAANVYAIRGVARNSNSNAETLAGAMQLFPQNALYE